CVQAIAFPRTF
nr:immunoglobulin light chain junction region [Macaca mulatta]